jgi:hypothetical protein
MTPKKTTVTLEDLIRLKRVERPPAEFWAEFDRDLRTKQLAAIVEPRPWWAPLIRVRAKISHYQVPVGAAAILALSFVAVREYRIADFSPAYAPETEVSASILSSETETTASVTPTRVASQLAVSAPAAAQINAAPAAAANDSAADLAYTGYASHSVPLPSLPSAQAEPSPSARYIAANLAAAQAADPRIVDDAFGSSVRTIENREPVRDPLAQISAPGESRLSRLLEPALPVAARVAVGTSDRVARRLTEDRLYDTISRVGVQGDRVAFKF